MVDPVISLLKNPDTPDTSLYRITRQ